MPPADAATEQLLLADASALRRLARSLLAADDADDVVQDAALAALRTGPAAPRDLRQWLRGAVHKLARLRHRAHARRHAREARAALSEQDLREPAALAMQAELVRDVGAAVHALDEPLRSAVLMHFWHGKPAAAIAARLGLPASTVRSRLQRALELLRENLDRRHGRERWGAGLAACASGAVGNGMAAGLLAGFFAGVLMKAKVLVSAAAVLLLAIVAATWPWSGRGAPPSAAAGAAPATAAAEPATTDTEPAAQRQSVAMPAAAPVAAAGEALVRGRCVDAERHPLAGCTVTLRNTLRMPALPPALQRELSTTTVTGSDGTFALALPPASGAYELLVDMPDRVGLRQQWSSLEAGRAYDLGDLVLPIGGGVAGRVVDPGGKPVARVHVRLFRSSTDEGPEALRPNGTFDVVSDAAGCFGQPAQMAPGNWGAMLSMPHATDFAGRERAGFAVRAGCITDGIELVCKPVTAMLAGEVVDARGAPIAKAALERTGDTIGSQFLTDADGRFELPRLAGDASAGTSLLACAPGYELLRTPEIPWGTLDARIVLQRSPDVQLQLRRDDDGTPVAAYGLRLAQHPAEPPAMVYHSRVQAELPCRPRANGNLSLCLPRGRYVAWVEPEGEGLVPFFAEFAVDADPSRCALRAPRRGQRQVHVVDGRQQPVAGTRAELLLGVWPPQVNLRSQAYAPRLLAQLGALRVWEGGSDANGELHLEGQAGTAFSLRLLGPGHRPLVVDDVRLDAGLEPLQVIVDVGATVSGTVGPAGMLAALGASASELEIGQKFGEQGRSMLQSWRPWVRLQSAGDAAVALPEKPQDGAVADDGSFRIDGVPMGSWQVCLDYRLPGLSQSAGVRAREVLATIRIEPGVAPRPLALDAAHLLPGTLHARALVDGVPFANGKVRLLLRRGGIFWGGTGIGMTTVHATTDAGGVVEGALPPGDWALEAEVDDGNGGKAKLRNEQRAAVAAGQRTEAVFALQRRLLRVRVLQGDGSPCAGRSFVVLQDQFMAGAGKTDAEGWLAIRSVPDGAFELATWPLELAAQDAQTAYIRSHPYPEWMTALIRLGPLTMPAGQAQAECEVRLPR